MKSHEPVRRVRLDPNLGSDIGADREPGLAHLVVGLTGVFVFTSLTLGTPPVPTNVPALRTAIDIEMLVQSPSTDQLAAGLALLTWAIWLGWGLLVATTLLRVLAVVTARVTSEAAWARSFRTVSDVVTLPWVRRAVDASLAGTMFLRVSAATFAADEMAVAPAVVQTQFHDRFWRTVPEPPGHWHTVEPGQPAYAPELGTRDVLYTVEKGDSLGKIADRFYGTWAAYRQIYEANAGRDQPDGRTLENERLIYPGWRLVIPAPTREVYIDGEGHRVYSVRQGDTLSAISARLLGDSDRFRELFAINEGADLGDGRRLTNPGLIWPGLRLRLPDVEDSDAPSTASESGESSGADANRTSDITTAADTSTPTADPTDPNTRQAPPGADASAVVARHANSGDLGTAEQPSASAASPIAEAPARSGVGEPQLVQLPNLSDVDKVLLAVAGLSPLVVLALRARQRRRGPHESESGTALDEDDFTAAQPAAVVEARRGGDDDPHGIVTGERIAGELLRRASKAGLADVHVVSVDTGRTALSLSLATRLANRAPLEMTLGMATDLARRVRVSRSRDQDVVVRLEGVRHDELRAGSLEHSPVLLCVGVRPRSGVWLVGWRALGQVLVACQPESADAQEYLAALVATLAGQFAPADLGLYTLAEPDGPLGRLLQLPHHRAAVDPRDSATVAEVLAGLREEVERRQQGGMGESAPELVLVADELAQLCEYPDMLFVLKHGQECGIRVLSATASAVVEQGSLVESFETRIVFRLADDAASTRLLGNADAVGMDEPGRLLARVGRRAAIELLGLHLTDSGLQELYGAMGVGDARVTDDAEGGRVRIVGPESLVAGNGEPEQDGAPRNNGVVELSEPGERRSEPRLPLQEAPGWIPDRVTVPSRLQDGIVVEGTSSESGRTMPPFEPVAAPVPTTQVLSTAEPPVAELDCPVRVKLLLERAPLVLNCEDASVWSSSGRLAVHQSALLELLVYIATTPLQVQGSVEQWEGVSVETVLQEVWAPRARDSQNPESGQTWLRKSLLRLQKEMAIAGGGLPAEVVVERDQHLRVNREVLVSDIEALMIAVERARAARGIDRIAAAEQAVLLRVPGLLLDVPREQLAVGRTIPIYGWLDMPQWEQAAGRLAGLWREAAGLLARAHREGGHAEAAIAVYALLLGEDPLDRRAHEGLLLAAADTRDATQLRRAWQQTRAFYGGETDVELRALYERLLRELGSVGSSAR